MTCFGVVPVLSLASRRFVLFLFQSIFFLYFLNVLAANAQTLAGLEQGIKPYGTYDGGDIDSISMVNGSLTLHIPLISYPQRGGKLHMNFHLVYANTILQPFAACNPVTHTCTNEGYNVDHQLAGVNVAPISLAADFTPYYTAPIGPATPSTIVDFDGAVHTMAEIGGNQVTDYLSVDATGYLYANNGNGTGTIVDRHGNQYNTATGTIEDTNGNLITTNTNSQNVTGWTDTMGRVIPAPWNTTSTSNFSGCTGSQSTASATLWTPPGPNGGTSQFKLCYASFNISFTAPDCSGACAPTSGSAPYLQSVVLPNGTAWTFEYDNYNSLSSITLPTGGTISYAWTITSGLCVGPSYVQNGVNSFLNPYGRAITSRTLNANDGTGTHVWNYSIPTNIGSTSPGQTIVTDPNLNDAVHWQTYLGTCSAYETELDQYSGSHTSGTLLRKVATTYKFTTDAYQLPTNLAINAVPATITTTDELSGKVSQVTKTYDSGIGIGGGYNAIYGDLLTQSEYDFGSGAPGSLLRTTTDTYMALTGPNASSYLANNLLDLPYTVQVQNGSGTQVAYTTYGYDETALQTSNVTEQKTTGESHPGNQTSVHRWLNGSTVSQAPCSVSVSNGYLVSNNVFYDTGEVQKSTDPCGYLTTYQYSSTYYGAFPTTVTNALNQSTTYVYDSNTGSVTSITDPNLQKTTKNYDIMNRLTKVSYPDGGSTQYCYTDSKPSNCSSGNAGNAPFAVVVTEALASPPNKISTATLDGLARLSQIQLNSDPSGTTYTLTTYDPLGRKSQVYNPTRCNPPTTNCGTETTWGYSTYTYDALGRTTQITHYPDGTSATLSYTGRATSVLDEGNGTARVQRITQVDGMGRLTSVCEVTSAAQLGPGGSPAACGQDIAGTGFLTTYSYDALGNLLAVNQGSLGQRTFAYDSLSRLLCAANPETDTATCPNSGTGGYTAGTTGYAYDADGNLISRTRPAPNQTSASTTVATTYAYDTLNRVTQKSYSDGVTLPAEFGYDQTSITMGSQQLTIANSVGRLSWTCVEQQSAPYCLPMTALSYDPMGRTAKLWQSNPVNSNNIFVSYLYDLLGDEINRNVNGNTYAATYNAVGRLTSFTATDYTDSTNPANLLTGGAYDPFGHLTAATFANGLSQSWGYDSRGRPQAMAVGTTCSAGQCTGSTVYSYSIGYAPDSDILSSTDTVGGKWTYTYDGFNRLLTSNCSANCPDAGSTQGFSYGYDRYSNRWNQTVTAGSGPQPSFTFNGAQNNDVPNNRIDGYSYDAAGNLLNDGINSYRYDAENRIISVNSGATTYNYDALGRRVAKNIGGSATDFIYDREGHVILNSPATPTVIEVNVQGLHVGTYVLNSAHTDTIFYYDHGDWLGTERARTNLSGTACETITSLPFGDAQSIAGTCGDVSPKHFTGKERDSESGLDNFGARYDASSMGRFMTPDSPSYSNHKNPQSWNLYAYALNNPVTFRDADGHKIDCANNTAQCQADAAAATGNAQAASQVTTQTTTTQHSFLGLFHWTTTETQIAIKGDINSFRALSPNASKLADLVTSKDTITVSYGQYAQPSFWHDPVPLAGGSLSYTPNQGYAAQGFIDPTRTPGAVYDPDAVAQGIPQATTGEEFGHEVLGHIWGEMFGGAPAGTRANMRDSIAGEDAVRALDPARGQKGLESHHNYNEMPPDPKQ